MKLNRNKLDILFENDDLVAINKPSGMLTIPDRFNAELPSLYTSLQKQYDKIFIVHRLDRETSGVVIFAKNEATHKWLSGLFENRTIDKHYLGIVKGTPINKNETINEPIAENQHQKGAMVINKRGKPSITEYEVLDDFGIYSLVKFKILSGRTHQIRVHMKHIGYPIVCDEIYGDGKPILISSFKKKFKLNREEEEQPILKRLGLHAYQIKFNNQAGQLLEITAELPKDMKALLQQLSKQNHQPLNFNLNQDQAAAYSADKA
jgi:23S rRNA pseudouridine955/2504/2580 synthase/23S rRNA pseudouridine1911/1915/1917 synthase